MVPQQHPLGFEAEVDFGAISFYLAGVFTVGEMFVMRLSASGKAFRRAYLHEAQEVFFDGHVRAFDTFGGVPTRIRYEYVPRNIFGVLCPAGLCGRRPLGCWSAGCSRPGRAHNAWVVRQGGASNSL